MWLTKMTITAALALVVVVLGGVGGLARRAWAAETPEAPKAAADKDKARDKADGQGKAEHDCAWGKAVKGLQAGLRLRPGEPDSYAIGETATFVVKVRNVSDGPLEFRYVAPIPVGDDVDQLVSPSVLDADGQRALLSGPIFSGNGGMAWNKRPLAAGEEIEFATVKLTWGPIAEPRVTEKPIAHVKPGKYKVSYHVYYVNPDDTMNYLTTGQVEVRIKDSEK